MESDLILSRGGLPPLSARGCIQQLVPIETGSLRRTINGKLVYTGKEEGHKYRSVIRCEDKATLALEGIWRGGFLRVGCIQRLGQKVEGLETVLEREPMEGSVYALGNGQVLVRILSLAERKVVIDRPLVNKEKDIYISYRPWLDMCITDFSFTTNEWGLKSAWQLTLEEV